MFSKRQSSPYQPKIHLPIPFPRGSGSLQVQEIRSYKKEKKKRMLTNVLRDNHHPTNPRFTYQFYFQENPEVFKSKRSISTKKNINECFQRDNTILPIQDSLTDSFSKRIRSILTKKKEKKTLTNVLKETTTILPIQDSPTSSISKRIQKSKGPKKLFLQKKKKKEC